MASKADYLVIRDSFFKLEAGGTEAFTKTFSFPGGTQHQQSKILSWVFVFKPNANDLTYRWSIIPKGESPVTLRTSNATGNHVGSYQEVFKNVPFASEYTLKAEITGGSGRVDLSDVVVWFQNNA